MRAISMRRGIEADVGKHIFYTENTLNAHMSDYLALIIKTTRTKKVRVCPCLNIVKINRVQERPTCSLTDLVHSFKLLII